MLHQDSFDMDDETVRHGPLWRHALWAVVVTGFGVGFGWFTASFRLGPDEYGLPLAAPGPVWGYLVAWTVIGLVTAAVLRATAARIPVYSPGFVASFLTFVGTRISLSQRPEPALVGALGAACLVLAALWCAFALRRREEAPPEGASPQDGRTAGASGAADPVLPGPGGAGPAAPGRDVTGT
ncbi:hypothetical protein [Streptomyces corynorhini]|uniref:hypothetical protein n=1 Tax=Streptomyces corynorhini TaxID=2282652 RepID=UPI0026C24EF2|nr:hypothetical protein [Streptomyces corynorhini]